ncbi:MAG: M36 family metallopeptidase [Gammaproteobacteria bacterium]
MNLKQPMPISAIAILVLCVCSLLQTVFANENNRGRQQNQQAYLTAPSDLDPLEICKKYLIEKRDEKGLQATDISDMVVTKRFADKRNGLTHLYLRQRLNGIDVEGSTYVVATDSRGRIVSEADKLKRNLDTRAARIRGPQLSAAQAVRFAALALGEPPEFELQQISAESQGMKNARFVADELSLQEIRAKLNYLEVDENDLRLSWNIVIQIDRSNDWWNLFIDARSGELLKQVSWVAHESYNVLPLPVENPDAGTRAIVSGVAEANASPFGWHDTNGLAGAEFTDSRGNNVFVQEDADSDNSGGLRPDGGASLDFSPPLNPQLQPSGNFESTAVNLFYWSNIVHDILYQYGFDEAAGNFQQNNYGNSGIGGDAVQADFLEADEDAVNNALFATPPESDPNPPRMTMGVWLPPLPSSLEILAPTGLAGTYSAGDAVFGAWTSGLTGTVILALDEANAAGPTGTDGCTAFLNAAEIAGNIALVDRGECLFVEKTANAQAAGAIGLIVANNVAGGVVNMGGQDPALAIPVLSITQGDGGLIKSSLANGISANLVVRERRDSASDNGIIAHEYGHGLTNRLTGGANNSNCLASSQSRGMGEGWSDWLALVLTASGDDSAIKSRPIATYASGQRRDGPGIRNYPYTRDMGINPLTFAEISSINQPHGVGEVWAAALWDLYWNLVRAYGFDSNLYSGTGGNNIQLGLVIDALKLQPCNPTFLEARDSIITADLVNNGGANQCMIWEAFARRGMGESAVANSAGSLSIVEAFDEPAICATQCGNNVLDVGEQCDDGNTDGFDGCASNCRVETTLPVLTGTASGGSVILILDGVEILITTSIGQSAATVAGALASAVNNSTTLQAVSGIALNDDAQLVVTGEVDEFILTDAGLSLGQAVTQVPVPWQWRLVLCALILILSTGLLSLRRTLSSS